MFILTDKKKRKYVSAKIKHCPFCGNIFFNDGGFFESAEGVCREITCDSCGKGFFEVYVLDTISDIEKI